MTKSEQIFSNGWRRHAGVAAAIAALLVMSGCSSPSVEVGPTGDAVEARKRLEAALPDGPVRLQIFGDPYGLDPKRQDRLIAGAIAEGVQNVKARFSPDPGLYGADQPRLVVVLNPQIEAPNAETCRSPERIRTGPATEDLTVLAAFCEGERLINSARADGDVSGPTDKRLKRMLWQTAGVLFPDNYRNEYGLDLIPGLNIGLGGSFGF